MRPRLNDGGERSLLLLEKSYLEEGFECPVIDETNQSIKLLYPRSFVERIASMHEPKTIDYCFIGALYHPNVFKHRKWILDFAKEKFTENSHFQITTERHKHQSLGSFDYTLSIEDVFIPRETGPQDRAFFHEYYFSVMCKSKFTLCPAGDAPWSMRFF